MESTWCQDQGQRLYQTVVQKAWLCVSTRGVARTHLTTNIATATSGVLRSMAGSLVVAGVLVVAKQSPGLNVCK